MGRVIKESRKRIPDHEQRYYLYFENYPSEFFNTKFWVYFHYYMGRLLGGGHAYIIDQTLEAEKPDDEGTQS